MNLILRIVVKKNARYQQRELQTCTIHALNEMEWNWICFYGDDNHVLSVRHTIDV